VKNQRGKRIRTLRTENGTEYINERLKKFLEKEGVKQTTVSHTPEQSEQDR